MRADGSPEGAGHAPLYHPAGFDGSLRSAVEEVRAGRWMAMRDLLLATGDDFPLRTSRTQVLAVAAAGSDVVHVWRAEEPRSPDALLMEARVLVERAVQAHRKRHHGTRRLEEAARERCQQAVCLAPADPVPWICLLTLAQLDEGMQRAEHRQPPPEHLLPTGPWSLLSEAHRRDPYNREAFHRMLQFLHARRSNLWADTMDFALWVSSLTPSGSALLVMPLYVHAEHARRQLQREKADLLIRRQWVQEHVRRDVQRALDGWFDRSEPATRSTTDLNHLAHALWAGTQFTEAARVFEAIGPYATWLPWAHVSDVQGTAEDQFLRARTQSQAYDRRA
jgi:hypothetical protein